MTSRRPRRIRALPIALAVAVYALPACLGMLSALSHGASHLIAEAAEQRRLMASTGLNHSAPEPGARTALQTALRDADANESAVPRGAVVHTHGGSTHAHGGVVGTLLTGTSADDGQITAAPVVPTVAVHLPAPHAATAVSSAPAQSIAAGAFVTEDGPRFAPQPQPPRV